MSYTRYRYSIGCAFLDPVALAHKIILLDITIPARGPAAFGGGSKDIDKPPI